jgi:ABC-2 type transport system ATP-binding protein
VTAEGGTLSISLAHPDEQNPELVRALVEAGAHIRAVEPTSHSLEEVYLELVENTRQAAAVSH